MEYLNDDLLNSIALELNIKIDQVKVVLEFLKDDCTVPFISRYRKEQTGALDEVQIRFIEEKYQYGVQLQKRKTAVLRLIEEKGMLTEELKAEINAATKLIEVEDLYLPFKEKKKTKATEAIRKGLSPLADIMLMFLQKGDTNFIVSPFIKGEVTSYEDAINGAKYIIAEKISDNASYRKAIRNNLFFEGTLVTKKKKNAVDELEVYKNYYEYSETVKTIKPHRILAINRAEDENVISVSINANVLKDINYLNKSVIKKANSIFEKEIKEAINDSYDRLIFPSIEREIRAQLSEKGENQAIEVFSVNLKNLLLQAPLKGKVVLGVDPAFRTGCKLAVVSQTGKVLEIGVIYPNEKAKGQAVDLKNMEKSIKTILDLYKKYKFELIAIGNGTASRETESFIASVINDNKLDAKYVIVSEAGASVYSASELAQEEFPTFEVQERSAVSIARRLQDPLSELVKIDPKSIGVGQYQHDVSQAKLTSSLDAVVEDAVNKVGVNVNTASLSLLTYVSGLNKNIANNIVLYRDEFGPFNSRTELKKVPKLGAKTFEQAVGFLRIPEGKEKLDSTSIHPESYKIAKNIMEYLNIKQEELGNNSIKENIGKVSKTELKNKFGVDEYTLNDILDAFIAPTRDPRDEFAQPKLRSDILHLEDLKIGDELEGTVRNVIDFGAFVDCGVKYDGLVHVSKISNKFIKHPSEVLSVGDLVKVYVIGIDLVKNKLSLSMLKQI